MLTQASVIGVVTVGMTFVITSGGIDLSVGAIVALASVWATTVATQEYGFAGILFTAVIVGVGCGLVNGLLIAYGGMVPFIATLAMLASARGLALQITDGSTQVVTVDAILDLGERDAYVLGIPPLVLVFARFLYRQQASSDVRTTDLVGQSGRVVVAIPAGGVGQVRCRVGEELIDKIAQARDGARIPENAAVRIEEVLGETVIVTRQ